MTTVLIAVDATDSSVKAVETAHRLFGDDADYLVVNAGGGTYVPVPIFPSESGLISPLAWAPVVQSQVSVSDTHEPSEISTDEEVAETIAKQISEEGGLADATALGIVGDAASAIVEVAVGHSADVIVVGTHERGWLTRLLTTSVADEVRRVSPIPVLVLPHPDEHERDH